MSNDLEFELIDENKNAIEELLKASGIRHFIFQTKDFGNLDLVEYKEYLKLKEVLDKIKEYIENNSLYEEEYDYDYEENIHLSGIDDTQAKKDILELLEEIE